MAEKLRVLKDLQCTPQTLKKAESWLRCDVGGMQCAVPQPVLTAYFQSIVEFGDGARIEHGDKGGVNFIDRDPTMFRAILRMLCRRFAWMDISHLSLKLMEREMQYYSLELPAEDLTVTPACVATHLFPSLLTAVRLSRGGFKVCHVHLEYTLSDNKDPQAGRFVRLQADYPTERVADELIQEGGLLKDDTIWGGDISLGYAKVLFQRSLTRDAGPAEVLTMLKVNMETSGRVGAAPLVDIPKNLFFGGVPNANEFQTLICDVDLRMEVSFPEEEALVGMPYGRQLLKDLERLRLPACLGREVRIVSERGKIAQPHVRVFGMRLVRRQGQGGVELEEEEEEESSDDDTTPEYVVLTNSEGEEVECGEEEEDEEMLSPTYYNTEAHCCGCSRTWEARGGNDVWREVVPLMEDWAKHE